MKQQQPFDAAGFGNFNPQMPGSLVMALGVGVGHIEVGAIEDQQVGPSGEEQQIGIGLGSGGVGVAGIDHGFALPTHPIAQGGGVGVQAQGLYGHIAKLNVATGLNVVEGELGGHGLQGLKKVGPQHLLG